MQTRTGLRWLAVSAGVVVLLAVLLWLAAAPVIGFVVERQLRLAGATNPRAAGASLAFPDVVIDRLRLAPAEAFVLDDVRLRIGAQGIERVAIGRLRLEARVSADGSIVLPGFEPGEGGERPFDVVPDQGVRMAAARIRLATPAGDTAVSLSDLRVQRTAEGADASAAYAIDHAAARWEGAATAEMHNDGTLRTRLEVTGGQMEVGGVRATGFTGDAAADLPAQGAPSIAVGLETGQTLLADVALGGLAIAADWRGSAGEFSVTSPDSGTLDVAIDGRADLADGARSASLSGRVVLQEAQVQGQLGFDADVAVAPGGALSGQVRVTGRGLALPDGVEQGAVEVTAAIEGDTDRPRLTATAPWTAVFTPVAALVPEAMQALAGEAVSIAIAPRSDRPLVLQLAWAERSARLEGAVEVSAGASRLSGAADLAAGWDDEVSVTAETLELTARDLPWTDLVLGVDEFQGEAAYAADGWRVSGAGTVNAAGSLAGASYEGLTARWSGTITGTSQSVAVAADECVVWRVAAVQWRETTRFENLSPPCIQPGDGDVLATYGFDAGTTRFAASTAEAPLEVAAVRAGERMALTGTWPAFEISGATDGEGVERLDASVAGGAVILTQDDVAIEGVDGSVEVRGHALRSASLTVAAIRSRATPAVWAPVSLEATATGQGTGLSFDASISDELGIFVMEAAGRYEDGRGASRVTLYPLRFISGATEIGDLSPRLGEYVTDASGTVGFEGEILWGPDGLESRGDLHVQEFGATISEIPFAGVNTSTAFDALLPPATLPEQTVRIGRISLGVPLTDGVVIYDLDPDGRLAIGRLDFQLAGGRVYAEPFTVDSGEMGDAEFVLRVDEVELSQVLELSQIQGLQGTGVLSGRVPVRLSDEGLQLDEGNLTAETDGVLRYTPEDLPDFLEGDDVRSRMLREVLTNFQYDELSVTVAGESGEGGQQRLRLSANGANPDFLDGHPIELNLNFQGPLLGAMRSAVDVSGAGGIQQMFEEQEVEEREAEDSEVTQ